ncbi:MAG: peptide chain release factor 2 [Acidimicrobiia bacterium]
MEDIRPRIQDAAPKLEDLRSFFDIESKRVRAKELHELVSKPDFWDDKAAAGKMMTELARIDDDVEVFNRLSHLHEEAVVYESVAREEGDQHALEEAVKALNTLDKELRELEVRTLLGGEYDENDAIASVHAGAGGTESCDWAEMLLRMFLRWVERRGLEAQVVEVLPGEEAGVKRATFTVKGRFAYGLLSTEKGVHRLVRISPFDASRRRHTSFASLDVLPEIEEEAEAEIDPKDLRVETYRSSGAGGQHVNVTDSAVRITHIPSGLVVAVQNERSQLQNRAVAMKILASRLAVRAREERQKELEEIRGEQMDIGFGSQIRSYVLHPYRMIKDHRTEIETSNVDQVLDGDLDDFIAAELRRRRTKPNRS